MGYRWNEVEKMTLVQFLIIASAYEDRQEDEWERTAHLMSAVINYGGMGVSEPIKAEDIFNLRKHQDESKKPITTWDELKEMLEEM